MTAEEFATQIAATFGATPARVGREYRVFCPHHEADGGVHKPSLAVWDKGSGRCAWKCMTGCSKETVKAALKARGVSVPGSGPLTTEQMLANALANEARRVDSLKRAWEAYSVSVPVAEGDVVDVYLKSRGIDVTRMPGAGTIRTSLQDAMVGLILDLTTLRDETPKAKGVMTLALNTDGTPWLSPDGRKLRSIVGTQRGYGVPYGVPGPHLVVAEGVETMLSAMILLEVPFGVATLSAANMASLIVPEWVRQVTIAEDNDEAGQSAADATLRSLEGLVRVEIQTWGAWRGEGWDANDELMARKGMKHDYPVFTHSHQR